MPKTTDKIWECRGRWVVKHCFLWKEEEEKSLAKYCQIIFEKGPQPALETGLFIETKVLSVGQLNDWLGVYFVSWLIFFCFNFCDIWWKLNLNTKGIDTLCYLVKILERWQLFLIPIKIMTFENLGNYRTYTIRSENPKPRESLLRQQWYQVKKRLCTIAYDENFAFFLWTSYLQ